MLQITSRNLLKAGLGATALAVTGTGEWTSAMEVVHSGRTKLNFNRDFKFQLGDHPGTEASHYDPASWNEICLPHSFSTPYWGEKEFYVGYGWYRKSFQVDKEYEDKKLFLEF